MYIPRSHYIYIYVHIYTYWLVHFLSGKGTSTGLKRKLYIGLMGLFTVVSYREFECLHGPTMYLTMLATPSSDLSKYASDTDILAYPPARCGPAGFAEACVSTSPCAHWLSSASTMRNSYSIGGNSIYLQSIQDLYTISIYIRFLRLFGCIFGNFDFFLGGSGRDSLWGVGSVARFGYNCILKFSMLKYLSNFSLKTEISTLSIAKTTYSRVSRIASRIQ